VTLFWPTLVAKISAGGEYRAKRPAGHVPPVHQGVDNAVKVGTIIRAAGVGRVTALVNTGSSAGYGLYAEVLYVGGARVRYAHLSRSDVSVGQTVDGNTVLGLSGGTKGAFGAGDSGGPHCHIEVRVGGTIADPLSYLAPRSGVAMIGAAMIGAGKLVPPATSGPAGSDSEEDEMLYIKAADANGATFVRAGNIYRRVEGSWIGVTNLEGDAILKTLIEFNQAFLATFSGVDLEKLFATDGIWEQVPLDGTSHWGPDGAIFEGLGHRTGRRMYPGAPGQAGAWHYPHELNEFAGN
jgi:hypothetical protein